MRKDTHLTSKAFARIIVFFVLFINSILTAKGINPIPLDEVAVGDWISNAAAGLSAVWIWYKDAPLTKGGKIGHAKTVDVKKNGIEEVIEDGDIDEDK